MPATNEPLDEMGSSATGANDSNDRPTSVPLSQTSKEISAARADKNNGGQEPVAQDGMNRQLPSGELFERDPEEWLRQANPEWNEAQLKGALRIIRVVSLVEFYEAATAKHPELTDQLGGIPPARLDDEEL